MTSFTTLGNGISNYTAQNLGATGIWCAWPIGWCTATVLSLAFYLNSMTSLTPAS